MAKGDPPAIAIAMIMSAILSARSDEIPTLDVRPVCHGIASQGADPLEAGLRATFEQCTQSEQQVREQLEKEWSTFSAADKQHCVSLAKTGGESSYTELLTCLEMARDVRVYRSTAAASSSKEATTRAPSSASRVRSAASGSKQAATRAPASPSPPPASPPAPSTSAPSPPSASTSTTQPAPPTNGPSTEMVKDLQQAKVEAINARASESTAQRKLADTQADLKQAKEDVGRANQEAEQARADARAARQSKTEAERKLANAEAARQAAEEQEQACQSAAKSQPGIGGWLRGLFGHKPANPQNP
jgi:hypothetical protein